jgi:hypothetical protein
MSCGPELCLEDCFFDANMASMAFGSASCGMELVTDMGRWREKNDDMATSIVKKLVMDQWGAGF